MCPATIISRRVLFGCLISPALGCDLTVDEATEIAVVAPGPNVALQYGIDVTPETLYVLVRCIVMSHCKQAFSCCGFHICVVAATLNGFWMSQKYQWTHLWTGCLRSRRVCTCQVVTPIS